MVSATPQKREMDTDASVPVRMNLNHPVSYTGHTLGKTGNMTSVLPSYIYSLDSFLAHYMSIELGFFLNTPKQNLFVRH